jgi:hypothetical protein
VLGLAGEGLGRLVPDRGRVAVVLALAVAAFAVDVARRPGLPPGWRRQVDERWVDEYRPWVYGFGWGAQLGAGVLTIVSSAATYLVMGLAALIGSLPGGVALGVTFGLTRGLTLLLARGLVSPASLRSFHRSLQPRRRLAASAVVLAEGLVVLAATAALLQLPAGSG